MAQPRNIELHVVVDVTQARRAVRRVLREAEAANRELAKLEDALSNHQAELAAHVANLQEFGIRTEVDDE